MSKCWVYHKTEKPKIVDQSEAQSYYDDGWADTPAAFTDLSEVVDMTNDVEVQVVGEVMDEMKDRANDALKAETAKRKGLMALAESYSVSDPGELETADLRALVIKTINGENEVSELHGNSH